MEYSSSSRIDVKYDDINWFIHFIYFDYFTSCCDMFILYKQLISDSEMLICYYKYISIDKILWLIAIFFINISKIVRNYWLSYKKKLFRMIISITYIKIMIVFYNIIYIMHDYLKCFFLNTKITEELTYQQAIIFSSNLMLYWPLI